jgi:hypothetical protein
MMSFEEQVRSNQVNLAANVFIESQQSLHQKSDSSGLARRFSPRVSRRMGLSAKPPDIASGSFSMSIPKPAAMDGLRDSCDADEVD